MIWVNELMNWLQDEDNSDQVKEGKLNFLKTAKIGPITKLDVVGISNGVLKKKASEFYRLNREMELSDLLEGLDILWMKPMLSEARILTAYILGKYHSKFDDTVWQLIDRWVDTIDHWTSCDHLCIDVTGYMDVYENPIYTDIQEWINSDNFWRRRFAVVCFVKHARSNKNAVIKLLPLIDLILRDTNYYVRKSIPWLLREASKADSELLSEFIFERIGFLSKTEVRESMKMFDNETQEKFLYKYSKLN
ncbi:MAG: DNA alkylation repair protein [Candidatus Heimdallarchaeota archaeon]|nr:DNA alkylation repair protein [Candidatus Heimdallarchaeota archaeon]